MNQNERVLQYLELYNSITPLEALADLGIMRLSPRIGELEKEGKHFVHEMVTDRNRFGEKIRYTRYRRQEE